MSEPETSFPTTCVRRLLIPLLLVLSLACTLAAPGSPGSAERPGRTPEVATTEARATSIPPTPVVRPRASGLKTELVADGLQLPANLAFAPDGRLFFAEVSLGRVRVIEHGKLLPEPFAQVDQSVRPQSGLLGLTLDPDFGRTGYVYVYYAEAGEDGRPRRNRVVRFTEVQGKGTDAHVLLDDLPTGDRFHDGGHNGGRLGFGPDRKLYVTVGDTGDQDAPQQVMKLGGKVLRINPDGTTPPDNPIPGSPVYALGFRNPWGLGFHPLTGWPYVTENGRDGYDEVNRLEPGGNYGWPRVRGARKDKRFLDPLWDSGRELGGITGLAFYSGDLLPQYKYDLLFCTASTSHLIRLRLAPPAYNQVQEEEVLSDECTLDVATGPEGAIYFSTVNRIQRLVPDR